MNSFKFNLARAFNFVARGGGLLALMSLLSGCMGITIPTSADFATPTAFSAWACTTIQGFMPFVVVLAMFFALIAVGFFIAAKFGAGVLPGGFLSFANNNLTTIITGVLLLAIAPSVVLAVFVALGSSYGVTISCVFGAAAAGLPHATQQICAVR